jgi:plasmid stability protein
MADLLVRDISEGLTESLTARADRAGHSVSDEVKTILQREFPEAHEKSAGNEISALEALRGVFSDLTPEERVEFSAIMDEIEAERKKDFGRPFEDLE